MKAHPFERVRRLAGTFFDELAVGGTADRHRRDQRACDRPPVLIGSQWLIPSQEPPPGGAGDSGAPVISPDGRCVLFASSAGNLLLASNNTAFPANALPTLNVFLRDRTKRNNRFGQCEF